MPAGRVRYLIAATASVVAFALLPAAAQAHPEECASTSAVAGGAYADFFADWSAGENSCMNEAARQGMDDSGAQLAAGETDGTPNLTLLTNRPKLPPFEVEADLNSDLAFESGYAFQGNYDGVNIWDVREPGDPRLAASIHCPGSQNDVTVNDGILITSTDSVRNKAECEGNMSVPTTSPEYGQPTNWEGLRVFDVRNPYRPRYLAAVRTDCGSHTHTVVPERDRLIVYVQSYLPASGQAPAGTYECAAPHDKISVVAVPKRNPANARIIAEPVLFPDGGNDGTAGTLRATTGCHDITVYPEKGLAAGACTGEGVIFDIRNPANPKVLANIEDTNFVFWHSATFSNDGKRVLFTDEKGGGSGAECNPTVGPRRGADGIYDITDPANPRFLSYFKIPRAQSNEENCVAHNGNLIPNKKGRDVMVQSWYQGGVSVIDWTNKQGKVKEIAWFDRGPFAETLVLAGQWSTYYYNGLIYGSEIQRGFDVFELKDPAIAGHKKFESDTYNAQTQYSFGR